MINSRLALQFYPVHRMFVCSIWFHFAPLPSMRVATEIRMLTFCVDCHLSFLLSLLRVPSLSLSLALFLSLRWSQPPVPPLPAHSFLKQKTTNFYQFWWSTCLVKVIGHRSLFMVNITKIVIKIFVVESTLKVNLFEKYLQCYSLFSAKFALFFGKTFLLDFLPKRTNEQMFA